MMIESFFEMYNCTASLPARGPALVTVQDTLNPSPSLIVSADKPSLLYSNWVYDNPYPKG